MAPRIAVRQIHQEQLREFVVDVLRGDPSVVYEYATRRKRVGVYRSPLEINTDELGDYVQKTANEAIDHALLLKLVEELLCVPESTIGGRSRARLLEMQQILGAGDERLHC